VKHYLEKSNELQGLLGEFYAEGYFQKNGYAYSTSEQIHKSKNREQIEFMFGYRRILVNIPKEIQQEIKYLCTPGNDFEPYYVYDFLICKVNSIPSRNMNSIALDNFLWVEVKTGNSPISSNQIKAKSETKIPVMLCRVEGVFDNLPRNVGIDFSEFDD